ncbi:MAG TPA: Uma2 family endonuclease [Bryobacteraceae bacterium]|jgi:Uma2 family endonuclease|nr:Uma2 family endonuclease [Bryobacteraceae bacterium]
MATATATPALTLVLDMDTTERVVLRLERDLTDHEFFDFCQQPQFELFRIERNAEGDIIIMSPVGGEGTYFEYEVGWQLGAWAKNNGRGVVLSVNVGLKLPDGSTRSPDACWIPNELWRSIPRKQRKEFIPLVPPFVIEVRSRTDRKKDLHEKMLAYLRNGVELGWLIDPLTRTVRIYKPGEEFVELDNPPRIEAEGSVAGFVLDLKQIYDQLDL